MLGDNPAWQWVSFAGNRDVDADAANHTPGRNPPDDSLAGLVAFPSQMLPGLPDLLVLRRCIGESGQLTGELATSELDQEEVIRRLRDKGIFAQPIDLGEASATWKLTGNGMNLHLRWRMTPTESPNLSSGLWLITPPD